MKSELLQSLFHDIRDYGSIRIKKSKLLWMLGRIHETPSVWDMLMREWRAFDPVRPLYGMNWNDEISLGIAPTHDIAAEWATGKSESRQKPLQLAFVS